MTQVESHGADTPSDSEDSLYVSSTTSSDTGSSFGPHSAVENVDKVDECEDTENVCFQDAEDNYDDNRERPYHDIVAHTQDTSLATLGNFLSRPVLILDQSWTVGNTLFSVFNPWELFFDNPRVMNRVANFNLLRCTLKIKITINGNGMYYGRAMACYAPLQGTQFDSTDDFMTNTTDPTDLVSKSQLPHVFLDPTRSMGGTITAPFIWFTNYVRIPEREWQGLGEVTLQSLNPLQHANSATGDISISVFAWAEDVQLEVPTHQNPAGLVPQSGMENEVDEVRSKGYISKAATQLSRFAGVLAQMPVMRPYALASQVALSATAEVAKMFGYSRPTLTQGPEPMKPKVTGSLALCDAPDTSDKLTVESKQELSVDVRIGGSGEVDPLAIKTIAQRETYMYTFPWNVADGKGQTLMNMRVDPTCIREHASDGSIRFAACGVAAMPFKYWSGSMRYRFQVVCSAFHRGRIAVVYDPKIINYTGSEIEMNTNYIKIIDISNTQDFTIVVPNGQERNLIMHPRPVDAASDTNTTAVENTYFRTTQMLTEHTIYGHPTCNGILGVYVLNELTSPSATLGQEVEINIFVSAGDDFEVHVPDSWFAGYTLLDPLVAQSGYEPPSRVPNQDANAPENEHEYWLGPEKRVPDELNLVYTGEKVTSFRQLMKRFNYWRTVAGIPTAQAWSFYRTKYAWFPAQRGLRDQGMDTYNGTPRGGNYTMTTFLHWATTPFRAMRGSIRYKQVQMGFGKTSGFMSRFAFTDGNEWEEELLTGLNAPATIGFNQMDNRAPVPGNSTPRYAPFAHDGTAVWHSDLNPVCEIEVPFYSSRRFASARHDGWNILDTYEVGGFVSGTFSDNEKPVRSDFYVAAGDDFQCYFWMGMPKVWYLPVNP